MGVGGRTIASAKRNIDIQEFQVWIAYMRKKGMLEPVSTSKLPEPAKELIKMFPSMVVI